MERESDRWYKGFMANPESRPVSLGLVLVRVTLGLLLFLHAWDQITGPNGVRDLISGADLSSPFFAWWGEKLLKESPGFFSNLLVWIELLGGISLFLGALVRPFGLLVALAFGCCAVSDQDLLRATEILVAACALGCSLSGAGRALGLDAIFDQHFPRWVTWGGRRSD